MTKPRSATTDGLEPHWKVRVVIPGAILHLASRTEPIVSTQHPDHQITSLDADWIRDERYGDTPGAINWTKVAAVTWRFSP